MIPAGAAMTRTTTAATMLKGSGAMNALAGRAEAIVSVRLLPGQSVEKTLARIKKVAGKRVTVETVHVHSSCGVSSVKSDSYQLISSTIKGVFGGAEVMPFLTLPATDARWYDKVADNIYRFEPHRSLIEDGLTIHAAGERLRFDSLREGTEFFIRLIQNLS
jgi:carboxypeptidase PM20D1